MEHLSKYSSRSPNFCSIAFGVHNQELIPIAAGFEHVNCHPDFYSLKAIDQRLLELDQW